MTKVKLSQFDIEEMRWNCEMARLWLQEHFKQYKYSYSKRCKEAEWHIDFAILVYDEAVKRNRKGNFSYISDEPRQRVPVEREMWK